MADTRLPRMIEVLGQMCAAPGEQMLLSDLFDLFSQEYRPDAIRHVVGRVVAAGYAQWVGEVTEATDARVKHIRVTSRGVARWKLTHAIEDRVDDASADALESVDQAVATSSMLQGMLDHVETG